MLHLELTLPDGQKKRFPLSSLPAIAGRVKRAGIQINEASISREHARFFMSGETLLVADLNSSNGTFVNEKKVTRSELKPGDVIRLGRVRLVLVEEKPEVAPPPLETTEDVVDWDSEVEAETSAGSPAVEESETRVKPVSGREPPQPKKPAGPVPPTRLEGGSPSAGPAAGPAAGDPNRVEVRDRILQYSKISGAKRGSVLRADLSQQHPVFRALLLLALLAAAVGLFFLARWLTGSFMPDSGSSEETYDYYEEEEGS